MKKTGVFMRTLCIGAGAALLLTGCKSGAPSESAGSGAESSVKVKLDPQNPVSIEIWHYYNGPQKTAFDALIAEFNETVGLEQGVVVEAFSQGSINELRDKVVESAEKRVGANPMPDIFAAYADTAYQVDKMGMVAPLDKYLTKEEIAAYVPGYIAEGRLDAEGNLKIFPIAKSTEVFMLNATDWNKFSEATGAGLDRLATIEGVTQVAKAYYEWSGGRSFFGRDAIANYMLIGALQLGEEIFSVEGGRLTIHNDKEIMRRLWDNLYVPHINGWFGAYGRFRSDDIKTGSIIALVGSTSGSAYFPGAVNINDTESYPIESLVLPAPEFAGGGAYAVQQGAGMVVASSDEKHEYAAVLFLKWFTETRRNIEFSISSGYLPVKTEANSKALIESALQSESASTYAENLKKTLPVAVDMIAGNTMYTSKAFKGGTEARAVLEDSMMNKAKEDLAAMESLISQGLSRADAVARFDTDENFEAWFSAFDKELREAAAE